MCPVSDVQRQPSFSAANLLGTSVLEAIIFQRYRKIGGKRQCHSADCYDFIFIFFQQQQQRRRRKDVTMNETTVVIILIAMKLKCRQDRGTVCDSVVCARVLVFECVLYNKFFLRAHINFNKHNLFRLITG